MTKIRMGEESSSRGAGIALFIILPVVFLLFLFFGNMGPGSLTGMGIMMVLIMVFFFYILYLRAEYLVVDGKALRMGKENGITRRFVEKRRIPLEKISEFLLVYIKYPVSVDEILYPFYIYAITRDSRYMMLHQFEGKDAAGPVIKKLSAAAKIPWKDITATVYESEFEFTGNYRGEYGRRT